MFSAKLGSGFGPVDTYSLGESHFAVIVSTNLLIGPGNASNPRGCLAESTDGYTPPSKQEIPHADFPR